MTALVRFHADRRVFREIHDANAKACSVFGPLLVRLEETAKRLGVKHA